APATTAPPARLVRVSPRRHRRRRRPAIGLRSGTAVILPVAGTRSGDSRYDGCVKDAREERRASRRRPRPLRGRRPTTAALPACATGDPSAIDDILPADSSGLRMLIVGISPGLWTAAVNAPFARPGNRFWPSLHQAGLTNHQVDASCGLDP